MALWDVFIENDHNEWIQENGYSLGAFYACLPWLVDDSTWKMRARQYEVKIAPLPKEIEEVIRK